jgi:predicted esterase
MTKEARESDMADYVRYLDTLHAALPAQDGPSVLLGFSQGVATAARWACRGTAKFDAHIFWAGVFPPDLDLKQEVAPLRNLPTWVALGDADPYFKEDLLAATSERFSLAGVDHDLVRFQGAHHIDADALGQILAALR